MLIRRYYESYEWGRWGKEYCMAGGLLLGIDRARVAMIVAGFLTKEAFGNIFIIFLFHFNFFINFNFI